MRIFFSADRESFQGITVNNLLNTSIPLEKSFSCNSTLPYPTVYVTLYDVKFMPFAEKAHGDFGKSKFETSLLFLESDHNIYFSQKILALLLYVNLDNAAHYNSALCLTCNSTHPSVCEILAQNYAPAPAEHILLKH